MTEERASFAHWKQEQNGTEESDPLSDENIQAAIDALNNDERDKLVRLAVRYRYEV